MRDIPPQGKIDEHEPRIYFGEIQKDYSIVDAPEGSPPIELDTPGGGDSGNPAFLIVDNQPILLYCLFRGGYGSGPALHLYRREIQAAMDELCPGYTLETFDFASVGR